jgi:hypothetical protein
MSKESVTELPTSMFAYASDQYIVEPASLSIADIVEKRERYEQQVQHVRMIVLTWIGTILMGSLAIANDAMVEHHNELGPVRRNQPLPAAPQIMIGAPNMKAN